MTWNIRDGLLKQWQAHKKPVLISVAIVGLLGIGGVAALITNPSHTANVTPKQQTEAAPKEEDDTYYADSSVDEGLVESATADETERPEETTNTDPAPTPSPSPTANTTGQEYGVFGQFTVSVSKGGGTVEADYATSDQRDVQWSGAIPAHNQSKVAATMPLVSSAKNYTVIFQALPAAEVGDQLTYTLTAGIISKPITVVIVE